MQSASKVLQQCCKSAPHLIQQRYMRDPNVIQQCCNNDIKVFKSDTEVVQQCSNRVPTMIQQ
eukprot:6052266-Heterocapsa_arctica.AAC.1